MKREIEIKFEFSPDQEQGIKDRLRQAGPEPGDQQELPGNGPVSENRRRR